MMVFLLVSPLYQHQTHPRRTSYKNIIHKIRRQGGGGGTERIIDISQSNRQMPTPLPSPTRNWANSLVVRLVSWLACLFVLIIIPCGFLLLHLLGFQLWSWKGLKLLFNKFRALLRKLPSSNTKRIPRFFSVQMILKENINIKSHTRLLLHHYFFSRPQERTYSYRAGEESSPHLLIWPKKSQLLICEGQFKFSLAMWQVSYENSTEVQCCVHQLCCKSYTWQGRRVCSLSRFAVAVLRNGLQSAWGKTAGCLYFKECVCTLST